jgi:hypothetical protein
MTAAFTAAAPLAMFMAFMDVGVKQLVAELGV